MSEKNPTCGEWLALLLLILLFFVATFAFGQSQSYERKGNNFYLVKKERAESKATETVYTFTDSKGNVYPIYKTEKGKYFIWKTSQKTGKRYKYYLKDLPLNDNPRRESRS